jgi:hypothetical protein
LYIPPPIVNKINKEKKSKIKKTFNNPSKPMVTIVGTAKVDTGRGKKGPLRPAGYLERTLGVLNTIAEKHWDIQMKEEDEEERQVIYRDCV